MSDLSSFFAAPMDFQLPCLLLTIFILVTTLMITVRKKTTYNSEPRTPSPPGPWKLPIIGSMHHMLRGLPHRVLRDLAQKHGPLMLLRLGQVDFIVISSCEGAEEITKTHDVNFASRPQVAASKVICDGDIILSPYGSYWRQMRKICVVEMLSPKRVKSFSSTREEEISNLMKNISKSPNEPFNLSDKLVSMSNAIVAKSAFGDECRHQQRFLSAMKDAVEVLSGFSVADLLPSLQFISGFKFKIERIHSQMDKIFCEIVEEHRAKVYDSRDCDKPKREDLVDVLLKVKDHGELEIPITDSNIKAVIFDMFTAGTETTSTAINWAMAELLKNPEVMNKAQKEVREALKGKGKVEESDLSELTFLKLVIKETLRLHPPVAMLVRKLRKKGCQVLGHEIAAGTRVVVNVWALGRDPRYWEEPEKFKPERFDGSEIDFKGANFEFLPFGAGRRMCPGIGFGLATVELALAQLLFYFDWKLPNGAKAEALDMTETSGVSANKKSPLWLLAIPQIPVPIV